MSSIAYTDGFIMFLVLIEISFEKYKEDIICAVWEIYTEKFK